MMNLIQKFFSATKSNKAQLRENFSSYFYSLPEHQWISQNGSKTHFDKLFAHLPSGVIEALMTKYPVTFVPSTELKKEDRLTVMMSNKIVVFPEFLKLLASHRKSAVAYLAHELAFVLYELEGVGADPLMAEVEADKFVCDLGFTFELEEFLLMLDETIEKRLRLTYLTINHFKES
jgi:hypothetical protein